MSIAPGRRLRLLAPLALLLLAAVTLPPRPARPRTQRPLVVAGPARAFDLPIAPGPRLESTRLPAPGLVTAIAASGDRLWAGTFDAGLIEFTGENSRPVPLFDPRITALLLDEDGALLIGTADGLGRLDPRPGAQVRRVADPRGWLRYHIGALRREGRAIWAAAWPGLVAIDAGVTGAGPPAFRYFGAKDHDADAGLAGPRVFGFDLDREGGALWAGGTDGLSVLQGGRARVLRDLGGVLPDDWINDVRAGGGTIDVLTQRDGLLRLAPGRAEIWRFRLSTSPSAMQRAGEVVVFGTNGAGLAAALPDPAGGARLRTFGPAEGLGSRTVAAVHWDPARDRLLVGGDGGIDRVERASAQLGFSR